MQKSDSIAALAAALAKAQGLIQGAKKDTENLFFKKNYADLASVWDACRSALSTNGLAVIQTTGTGSSEGLVAVETTLAHSSGEWVSSLLEVRPMKSDPQALGSAITYARRYALSAIVGVAPEEDDGNAASQSDHPKQATQTKPKAVANPAKPAAVNADPVPNNTHEIELEIRAMCEDINRKDQADKMVAKLKGKSLKEQQDSLRLTRDWHLQIVRGTVLKAVTDAFAEHEWDADDQKRYLESSEFKVSSLDDLNVEQLNTIRRDLGAEPKAA